MSPPVQICDRWRFFHIQKSLGIAIAHRTSCSEEFVDLAKNFFHKLTLYDRGTLRKQEHFTIDRHLNGTQITTITQKELWHWSFVNKGWVNYSVELSPSTEIVVSITNGLQLADVRVRTQQTPEKILKVMSSQYVTKSYGKTFACSQRLSPLRVHAHTRALDFFSFSISQDVHLFDVNPRAHVIQTDSTQISVFPFLVTTASIKSRTNIQLSHGFVISLSYNSISWKCVL